MTGISRFAFSPEYSISRVIKGGWQLAGGHGPVDPSEAIETMRQYVEAGITTFDCGDIYTGVEEMIGQFHSQYPSLPLQVHTKYVPDLDSLPTLQKTDIERIIHRSLTRLCMDRLDLVQFHWWDYDIPGCIEAAGHLQALQQQGKIRYVGLTNFDTPHLQAFLDAGVKIKSIQLQYSVLDHRPENGMAALCQKYGIALLCYGTLAGGLLNEKYLGAPEPQPPFENRSLTKYKLIIDDFGGWELFQDLLRALAAIARKHAVNIGAVATRYVLQKEGVGAAIVGSRDRSHLAQTLQMFDFQLDTEELNTIRAVIDRSTGLPGDVYSLEREKGGRHAGIMKYNLNKV